MVSEKPPRHSKSKTEPVTIDLDSKDVTINKSEPKQATANATDPSADKPVESAKASSPSQEKPVDPIGAQQWDKGPDVNLASKSSEAAADKKVGGTSTHSAAAAEKTKDAPTSTSPLSSTSQANKASNEKPFTTGNSTNSAQQSKTNVAPSKGTSTSGAVAAGIFGGLVALIAAGSLQYAGYIPGLAPTQNNAVELSNLRSEIESLRQDIVNQPTQQPEFDTSAIDQKINALEQTISQQSTGIESVEGLSGKLSSLESQLSSLKSQLDEAASSNVALLERMTAAEEKINEPRDDIEVARAIAAAALKAAIDRGDPFLTELDTLAKVTPEEQQLKALQPFASTGVPSRSEILKSFPTQATNILAVLNQPDPNLGVLDRLTQSAMSLVRVRPVGNVAGDTPEAVIARIEDKLRNGDLKGAALEWDALPEEAKSVAQPFKQSLDARVEVENLVGAAVTRALTKNAE